MANNRAVLYARLSRSTDASTSITRQLDDLRALAAREGWTIVAELTDDGLSGRSHRANVGRAYGLLKSGDADVLAVWKLDRLTRQGLTAIAELVNVLDSKGSLFVALQDGLRSDAPTFRIIASVLSEVGRSEAEATSMRIKSAQAHLTRHGKYRGGNAPLGYRSAPSPDGKGRILELDPDEADIIRESAARMLAGESLYAIVQELNTGPTRRTRKGRWTIQTMRAALSSPVTLGYVVTDSSYTRGQSTRERLPVLRDDAGLPVQVRPAVLSPDVQAQVLALFQPTGATQRRRAVRLLSGIITCLDCGANLHVHKRTDRPSAAYRCSSRSRGIPCSSPSAAADWLDDLVSASFLQRYGTAEVFARVERRNVHAVEQATLASSIQAITSALGQTTSDAEADALTDQLTALRADRRRLDALDDGTSVEWLPTGQTYAELWATADIPARRRLIRSNITVVALRTGKPRDPARVLLMMAPTQVLGVNESSSDTVVVRPIE